MNESAWSQQLVRVRAGEHEEYSRVVFDWDSSVPLEITRSAPDTLRLVFSESATLDLSDAAAVRLRSIRSIEQMGSGDNQTVVQIGIEENSRFRQLASGTKRVLDVFHAASPPGIAPLETPKMAEAASSAPPPKPHFVPEEKPLPEPSPVPQRVSEPEPGAIEDKPESPSEPAVTIPQNSTGSPLAVDPLTQTVKDVTKALGIESAPDAVPPELPPSVRETGEPSTEPLSPGAEAVAPDTAVENNDISRPHVINVALTNAVGLAAFERDGYLWIVVDSSDVSVTPQVAGPQKDRIPPFDRFDLQGGTAFRTRIPDNMNLYGEGGGMVWRLVVTPVQKELKATEPQRRLKAGSRAIRNGSLFWMLPSATRVLTVPDPATGTDIQVATVRLADEFGGQARDFVDLEALHSPIGLAIRAKTDDVALSIERPGALVSHPKGLALLGAGDVASRKAKDEDARKKHKPLSTEERRTGSRRIFNFERWQMGGRSRLDENQRVIMAGLSDKDPTGLVEDLVTLAKLNLANGWGAEAIGFLELAGSKLPALEGSPEFQALRGVAYALTGKYEDAFDDLSNQALDGNEEIRTWRTYTLSGLEDWQQAEEMRPRATDIIESYPPIVRVPVALQLAEVALRAGKVEDGAALLAIAERDSSEWDRYERNTWSYLSGESRRQKGQADEAQALWADLEKGFDEFYRAKAGLALTEFLLAGEDVGPEEAIDRLERLRYIWRGDELETRINFRLGRVYLDNGEFIKGLTILRDAASLEPDTRLGREIAENMTATFDDLLMGEGSTKLTPLDAVTLYEQFPELTPGGVEGDRLVERLAENMVEADLLERAEKLLRHQIDHRLSGSEAARVGIRLAAIHLINKKPSDALATLDEAQEILGDAPGLDTVRKYREIRLLRARALSQMDRPVEALDILADMEVDEDVNRLRADIAWRSGEWDEAAEALEQMLADAGTNPARRLSEHQAELVLNRAVALNLADNRLALSQLRERFEPSMKGTSRARIFEVLTRPRQTSVLADRETLMSVVAEVDMFREFLDTYREKAAMP
ncbi:MAG: hypothetical protein EOM26_08565 [Alphaproteobacteria bacterium]|nr:hypothetical protein [Alphaproteobacteria bacterium]